jgi:hypothetical protein
MFIPGRNQLIRFSVGIFLLLLSAQGCDLAPTKPEEMFVLYRDRMKNGQETSARSMLSSESLNLVKKIESIYRLDQPCENVAILNALDPASQPAILRIEDTLALLDVRTLKGVNREIRLVRSDSKSKWTVDLTDELGQLENFLAARKTLDVMQEQAGEFAATWKAMDSQLSRKSLVEPEREIRDSTRDVKKTPTKKPAKAQKKGPSPRED